MLNNSVCAIAVLTFATTVPAIAQDTPAPLYIVSILGNDTQDAATLAADYKDDVFVDLIEHRGRFVTAPIAVTKELDNDWLPDSASAFPGDVVMIAELPDQAAVQGYLADVADAYDAWSARLSTEIRFLAAVAPNPGPQQFPMIGSVDSRGGDAFILLNAVSFDAPERSQPLIGQYFEVAGPIVGGAGTQFLATLGQVQPITGVFPHQVLFLSEWASEAAFEAVHDTVEWQAVAPFRNDAVTSFTEARGDLLTSQ
ncbi:DUF1330 domain-containing protein [uncultured Tateyamaria sp.]|uniref:DUF1330 domain-containing protein n=1 Tax=uncultured Tateyamaria sp. TaxID=455651 RepID=UPI00260B0D20|nr:DUF1330 domain-containing protein [uncultured Tateyamaria sp.]